MNKIIGTVCAIFINLSVFAESGKIVISGQVHNHSSSSIKITHLDNSKLVSVELDTSGNFSMSAYIEDGYYFLDYGRNSVYIYLYPNDELNLTVDAMHFKGTLVFEGQGSERNNYLAKKSVEGAQLTKDLEAFYKVDETTYIKKIEHVKNTHLASLTKYDVEDYFRIAEQKSLEYQRLHSIQNYKSNYKFYLGEEISPSEDFYAPIKTLNLENEEDYKKQPYYRYLVNSIWMKRFEDAPDVDGMIEVLRTVSSQDLAISLITQLYSKISSKNKRAKDYLDLIKRVTTHQPFIEAAENKYQEALKSKGLNQGDASPGFSYEAIDGKIVNLSDLRGNYVYIDVWATWCGPCIKQIPYLKQLEEHYQDNNIVFVSISVDKEEVKATWKQMVADRQLGGLQLFADKSFDSEFMNAYAVNSIPRFILIDPEGKIVNPEAPRPSFEKTRQLLDELLNE